MNIKEIAKLAEVSVSTVSKIVNGKDTNISRETRERVLKIVKEYHYVPYSKNKALHQGKSFRLGFLISNVSGHMEMLTGMVDTASENGYSTFVYYSESYEHELKNINHLLTQHIDGILWDKFGADSSQYEHFLTEAGIPYQVVDCAAKPSANNTCFDYKQLGYNLTKKLVENKHQKIGCIIRSDGLQAKRFLNGFQQCLYDNKIPFDAQMYQVWHSESNHIDVLLHHITGVVCYDLELAGKVYEQAASKNYQIPKDLSVVALVGEQNVFYMMPKLSAIRLPFYRLGKFVCHKLIDQIEKQNHLEVPFESNLLVEEGESIDIPVTLRNKKIVVVGALNMDILVNVGCFPRAGETIMAKNCVKIPGGKGMNQAIGAAKLGAEVYLIGRVGKDYEGNALYDALNANNVHIQGVKTDSRSSTGHAYVYVQNDGESSIVIYHGANANLSISDVEHHTAMFEHASFCLLQTEIQIETVEFAAKIAKKYGVKVLLKPAAISEISDTLMKNIDIFLPNHNELNRLYPQEVSLEEKAQHFLDRGAKTVIVTLGHKGCYLRNEEHSLYFEAADFEAVDTTGAADAFAATLAVYLSWHYDILTAIRYATYAAGFSITRQGVPPALVDKSTLELYLSDI